MIGRLVETPCVGRPTRPQERQRAVLAPAALGRCPPHARTSRARLRRAYAGRPVRLHVGSPRLRPLRFLCACTRPVATVDDYSSWLRQHLEEGEGMVDARRCQKEKEEETPR
jgi:hypothetical protein